jgi:hypothetical protein
VEDKPGCCGSALLCVAHADGVLLLAGGESKLWHGSLALLARVHSLWQNLGVTQCLIAVLVCTQNPETRRRVGGIMRVPL